MAGQSGISGVGIAALAGGALALWSAVKGKAWTKTLRELIAGNQPSYVQDYPIDSTVADSGAAGGATTPDTGGGTTPVGPGKTVCASVYGGPNDHTGSTGYHGDNLNGTSSFAELRMGTALGNLKYRQKVRITYHGKSVIAEKLDIGLGGPGCGGQARAIDLWWETAQAIGFGNGLDTVQVEILG